MIKLAKAAVERMLEYVARTGLPINPEHLLDGIVRGHSGGLVQGYTNTQLDPLTDNCLAKRIPVSTIKETLGFTRITAEGVYGRSGWMNYSIENNQPLISLYALFDKKRARHKVEETQQNQHQFTRFKQLKSKLSQEGREQWFDYGYAKPHETLQGEPKYGYALVTEDEVRKWYGHLDAAEKKACEKSLDDLNKSDKTLRSSVQQFPLEIIPFDKKQLQDYLVALEKSPNLSLLDFLKAQFPQSSTGRLAYFDSTDKDLSDLSLSNAHLDDTVLDGCIFPSILTNTTLKRSFIRHANFEKVKSAEGLDLFEAHAEYLQGENANLTNAKLRSAILIGANLRKAKLNNTDILGAVIVETQLEGAIYENIKELDTIKTEQARQQEVLNTFLQDQREQKKTLDEKYNAQAKELQTLRDDITGLQKLLKSSKTITSTSLTKTLENLLQEHQSHEILERYRQSEIRTVKTKQQLFQTPEDEKTQQSERSKAYKTRLTELQTLSQTFSDKQKDLAKQTETLVNQVSRLSSRIDKFDPSYTVIQKILKLRKAVLEDKYIDDELRYYIELNGMEPNGKMGTGNKTTPLLEWVKQDFLLATDKQVLLLQGEAGAGKSTFNKLLQRILWQDPVWETFKPGMIAPKVFLPIFIPLKLKTVDPRYLLGYVSQHLSLGPTDPERFTPAEINILKLEYQLLMIADGYDELPHHRSLNIYDENQYSQCGGRTKLLITCRNQRVFDLKVAACFAPHNDEKNSPMKQLLQREIAPIAAEQRHDFVVKYVARNQDSAETPRWVVAEYEEKIIAIPGLLELLTTPFLLFLTLGALLKIEQESRKTSYAAEMKKETETAKLTLANLYDYLMQDWFEKQADRNGPSARKLDDDEKAELVKKYRQFCLEFAIGLDQSGSDYVQYYESSKEADAQNQQEKWLVELFGSKNKASLEARQGAPLSFSIDHRYQFIHGTLIDYFYTTALHEKPEALLPRKLLTRDRIKFLVDRVKTDAIFKEKLFNYIERSKLKYHKTDSSAAAAAIAAANSITILNIAGESFSGKDFRGIQIPGANLSGAICDSTDFTDANLANVNFRHAWLQNAKLTRANMPGTDFVELPSIENDQAITTMAMDPQNRWLLTGDMEGRLIQWDLITNQQFAVLQVKAYATDLKIISGLFGILPLSGLCISADGHLAAVATWDTVVHIWDLTKGSCQKQLVTESTTKRSVGQEQVIKKMAFYEAQGQNYLVMLGNLREDSPYVCDLQIWDIAKAQCVWYPAETIWNFAISPNGKSLAYCQDLNLYAFNDDHHFNLIIRSLEQEANFKQIYRHPIELNLHSLKFSPNGRWVGGLTKSAIQLYDTTTWQLVKSLPITGHGFSFDPSNELLIIDRCHVLNVLCISSGEHLYDLAYQNTIGGETHGPITNFDLPNSHLPQHSVFYCTANHIQRWLLHLLSNPLERQTNLAEVIIVNETISNQVFTSEKLTLTYDGLIATLTVKDKKGLLIIQNNSQQPREFNFVTKRDALFFVEKRNLVLSPNKRYIAFAADVDLGHYRGLRALPVGSSILKRLTPLLQSLDTHIQIWDLQEGMQLPYEVSHHNRIFFMFFSKDENWLVTAGYTLRIWDLKTGKCLHRYDEHKLWTEAAALSDCKQYLAISDGSGALSIWSTTTHKCLCHTENIDTRIRELAFRKKGDELYLFAKDEIDNRYQFHFDSKKNKFYLVNKSGEIKLSANQADITDVSGLSKAQQTLFKNKGAIGKPLQQHGIFAQAVVPPMPVAAVNTRVENTDDFKHSIR